MTNIINRQTDDCHQIPARIFNRKHIHWLQNYEMAQQKCLSFNYLKFHDAQNETVYQALNVSFHPQIFSWNTFCSNKEL